MQYTSSFNILNEIWHRGGDDVILTHDANTNSTYLVITIESDVALNNLVIKPMITDDLSATYSGFISYDNSLARGSHTHVKADITDFAHTHTKSQITDFSHTHDDRYYTESEIDEKFANTGVSNSDLLAKIYPVGSIYMSVNNVSPASFLGGTWEQLTDRFLLGAGSSYTVNATGGSTTNSHTHSVTAGGSVGSTALTVDQIPSHSHAIYRVNENACNGGTGSFSSNGCNSGWTMSSLSTGGGQGHSHSFSGSAVTSGDASDTNNMPPYLAVYM